MKKYLVLLIAVTLVAVILTGCTSSAPTSKTVPSTTPMITRQQDPIIGIWWINDTPGLDLRYQFNADGTWSSSTVNGTWNAQGGNSYALHHPYPGGEWVSSTKYDPARNCIYDTRYPAVLLTPYLGNVASASPAPTPKTTVDRAQDPIVGVWRYKSNTGDDRYHFYANGTWVWSNSGFPVNFVGTWNAQGGNSYALLVSNTVNRTIYEIRYDPSPKSIYSDNGFGLMYTPYEGDVRAAPTLGPETAHQ